MAMPYLTGWDPYHNLNQWALVMKRLEEIGKEREYCKQLERFLYLQKTKKKRILDKKGIGMDCWDSLFDKLTAPAEARMKALWLTLEGKKCQMMKLKKS